MNQPSLPHMPRRKQRFKDWVEHWLNKHYPDVKTAKSADEVRAEMFEDLPHRYIPSLDDLVLSWFTKAVQGAVARIAPQRSFLDDPSPAGKVVRLIVQPMLFDLDDFRDYALGKLVRHKYDLDAVRRDVEEYAANHPAAIADVDRFMGELRQAAGL